MINASILNRRAMHYVALAALLAASLLPALIPHQAVAAQLVDRSIQLYDSTPGDTTTYDLAFTPASAASSVVVTFCSNNPIQGDTCNTTGTVDNLDLSSASLGTSSNFGSPSIASQTANTITIDGTFTGSSAGNVQITGVVNDDTAGTFYGRIETFSSTGGGGSSVDFGGVALSTADDVTVTAKVHETLTFSVTTLSGSDNQIELGDSNGVLVNPATVYDSTGDNAEMSLATNAQTGAIVRLSGDTLTDGANDIDAAGSLGAFSGNSSTEEFGLHVDASGSTNITADADYNGGSGDYALVNTGGGQDDITRAGGAAIASTSGPTDTDTAEVEFAAQASNTTPAGVYTGTYTFIATGTF